MKICNWLTYCLSNRRKALFLYKRGTAKAKKEDHQGAIHDYTTMIGIPGTPADLMAMALYNRALVHFTAGDDQKGESDLDAVLAMSEAGVNVKTMARQKLARIESRSNKRNT